MINYNQLWLEAGSKDTDMLPPKALIVQLFIPSIYTAFYTAVSTRVRHVFHHFSTFLRYSRINARYLSSLSFHRITVFSFTNVGFVSTKWDTFASISLQRDYSRKWKIIVRIFLYFFYFICWHLRRRDKCRGKVQDFPFKFSEKFYFVYYMQSSDPRSFAFHWKVEQLNIIADKKL